MTKNQFEKFKKDLETIREYFLEIIDEVIVDKTIREGKMIEHITKKTKVGMQYLRKVRNNTLGWKTRIDTIIKFLDAYYEYKESK